MSSRTFLIGGGWEEASADAVYGGFLRAACSTPRIGFVVLDEGDGNAQFARYEAVLPSVDDCTVVPLLMPIGTPFDVDVLDGAHVCGGLTPAYQEASSAASTCCPAACRPGRALRRAATGLTADSMEGHVPETGW